MRLAIEITTCTPSRTGVGYYTEHLVDALLETRAADDSVVLLSNRPPAPELAERWSKHLHVRGPGVRAVWMQSEVPRLLSDTGADVAVFPNYIVPLASPCPTIVVVHDLAILRMPQHFTARKRLLMEPMLRQSVAAASVIATVSAASQRDIVLLLGVSPKRIAVLPCAPHPSCRRASAEDVAAVRARHGLSRPYILTVGTLEPRKDHLTLLRAFDRLGPDAENYDLVMVGGRGWQDRDLVQALAERASARRVRWLGYVPEAELAPLYTGASLFVFAATLEGFGLPVVEAMACGTPVVASDVAALREVAGSAARFAPPGDADAFARAMAEGLHGDAEQAQIAGPLRARDFSWTRTAEALWARARLTGGARVQVQVPAARASAHEPAGTLPPPLHPPPSRLTAREWALLAAVVYADVFESPLSMHEAQAASPGVTLDRGELRRLVSGPSLAARVKVVSTPGGNDFLVLAGREHLVDAMPEREALTRELLERNRATLSRLSALPFVRALVISGGVANRNPGQRPDVDLFVVAARGHAYTAYTMLFLATKLTGTRRVVCPNYLVEDSDLSIAYHHDLFTAHQLVSARPFSGQKTYEALCRANEGWVRRFFPGFAPRTEPDVLTPGAAQGASERAVRSVAPAIERGLRWAWRVRLRRRAASAASPDVVLSDGVLKLHLSDYRRRVLERFADRLQVLRREIDAVARPLQPDLDPAGT